MKVIIASLFLLFSVNTENYWRDSLVAQGLNADLKSEYDNGYPEHRYHYVLNTIHEIYSPIIEAQGGRFVIKRDWSDGAVNAWAERIADRFIVEVPGGMGRYSLINEEAFILTICHEIGHLLGGFPKRGKISFEGQSDYYAPMKCMRKVLKEIERFPATDVTLNEQSVKDHCANYSLDEASICERSLRGALSLSSYYAKLERRRDFPQFHTRDTTIAKETLRAHPKSQCRLDTYLASTLCDISHDVNFGEDNEVEGACIAEYKRPACWFKSAL
jgi:hypothetical protein